MKSKDSKDNQTKMGVYAKKEEWQLTLLMKAFEDDPNWNK